jgi:hypothetical protein
MNDEGRNRMIFKSGTIAKTACIALTLTMTTTAVFTASATAAFAERGGNGNGRANRNNRDTGSANRERSGNNGVGHLARELRGLNAAHANGNALANASPNSMPGKLYIFKMEQEAFSEVIAIQDQAYSEYQRLNGLTEEEVLAEFPDGGYEGAVTTAADNYALARKNAVEAQITTNESLSVLTEGRELSDAALLELWRLLNL